VDVLTDHGSFQANQVLVTVPLMLADAKEDLIKDGEGPADNYV